MASPSAEDIVETRFQYTPLDTVRNEIRLIKVFLDAGVEELRCTILHATLDDPPSFDALSYAWRDDSTLSPESQDIDGILRIDNGSITIGKNLEMFLRMLQKDAGFCEYIWVDAVCIDQGNVEERNVQVLRMREIYEKAHMVLIWLGPEAGDGGLAISFLNEIGARVMANRTSWHSSHAKDEPVQVETFWVEEDSIWVKDELSADRTRDRWAALIKLFSRAWWHRIWIIQELVLARKPVILCGSDYISFTPMSDAMYVLQGNWHWMKTVVRECGVQISPEQESCVGKAYQSFFIRNRKQSHGYPNSLGLISYTRNRLSTDGRDHPYGILGLAADASSVVPAADYSILPLEVFKRYTASMVKIYRNLDVLCLSAGIGSGTMYPSWCPLFESGGQYLPAINPVAIIYGAEQCPSHVRYLAAGTTESDVRFSKSMDVMTAKGFLFDTVDGLGSDSQKKIMQPKSRLIAYQTDEESFTAIWKTLVGGLDRVNLAYSAAPSIFAELFVARAQLLNKKGIEYGQPNSSPESSGFDEWYEDNQTFIFGEKTVKEWSESPGSQLTPYHALQSPTQHRSWMFFERNVLGVKETTSLHD
jgi:hypothetical protein